MREAFINAWKPGGVAYEIVKNNDIEYLENLTRILEESIIISNRFAQRFCQT